MDTAFKDQYDIDIEDELEDVDDYDIDIETEEYEDDLDEENREQIDTRDVSYATDDIKIYLKAIGDYKLLSSDEEVKLSTMVHNGNKEARNKLVNHNLRLVVSIAKGFTRSGVDLLDLIQEGNLGLMRSIETYDPTTGNRFSTYATPWIKQYIVRYIMNSGKTIRIPVHVQEVTNRIFKQRALLAQELGREPSDEELAHKCDISVIKLNTLMAYVGGVDSIDREISSSESDGDSTLGDFLASDKLEHSPEEIADRSELRNVMTQIMNSTLKDGKHVFSEKERKIIDLRYGFSTGIPMTFEEIAVEMHLTRQRVDQIEKKVLNRLKNPKYLKILKDFV